MFQILVCDDNKEFLKLLVLLLEKYAALYDADIIGFDNGQALVEYCRGHKPDLIYMDIKLGGKNGMMLGKIIKAMYPKSLMVYISAYDDYYVDMVQAEPFRFIPKDAGDIPKLERQLADTLEAAVRRISGREMWTFSFNRKKYNVELGKIKYFHSAARIIYIVGDLGRIPMHLYRKMDELQAEIESLDGSFVRISKSCIVNMKHIQSVRKNKVEIDNKLLTVTAGYQNMFAKKYEEYWNTDI